MLEKIFRHYGREIELHRAEGITVIRAFLQPVTGRGENMLRVGNAPLGLEQAGQYVYIGPVTPALSEGDMLVCPEGEFLLRRCERVEGTAGCAYCWGMCVRKGAEDTWGFSG